MLEAVDDSGRLRGGRSDAEVRVGRLGRKMRKEEGVTRGNILLSVT